MILGAPGCTYNFPGQYILLLGSTGSTLDTSTESSVGYNHFPWSLPGRRFIDQIKNLLPLVPHVPIGEKKFLWAPVEFYGSHHVTQTILISTLQAVPRGDDRNKILDHPPPTSSSLKSSTRTA